jgi:uncharacterized protein DUF3558
MKVSIRPLVLIMLLGGALLSGCTQQGPGTTDAVSPPATESADETSSLPTDDPCKLVTDAEVGRAFAQNTSGERSHALDSDGIFTCQWDTPTGVFIVQIYQGKVYPVEEELRSRVSGSLDPVGPGTGDRVRYETLANVGDQAMMVVEQADAQHGILADTAVLIMRRGERMAILFTGGSLAGGDRASALKALETLGRSAGKRL